MSYSTSHCVVEPCGRVNQARPKGILHHCETKKGINHVVVISAVPVSTSLSPQKPPATLAFVRPTLSLYAKATFARSRPSCTTTTIKKEKKGITFEASRKGNYTVSNPPYRAVDTKGQLYSIKPTMPCCSHHGRFPISSCTFFHRSAFSHATSSVGERYTLFDDPFL